MAERETRVGIPDGETTTFTAIEAWLELREAKGERATVIDLYRLVAAPRGLEPHELPTEERWELARATMPHVWPGFETTRASARYDPVEVVDYDPAWPELFTSWRGRIEAALGPAAVRIEHVGSTSVPGLAAKPTVDIQVSVDEVEQEPAYVPQLEGLELQLRSRDQVHRYFRPPASAPRSVHVHVCNSDSDWERHHLKFRDRLRADPQARDRYAAVKREAARLWVDDRWAYTDAKTEVILDILER